MSMIEERLGFSERLSKKREEAVQRAKVNELLDDVRAAVKLFDQNHPEYSTKFKELVPPDDYSLNARFSVTVSLKEPLFVFEVNFGNGDCIIHLYDEDARELYRDLLELLVEMSPDLVDRIRKLNPIIIVE